MEQPRNPAAPAGGLMTVIGVLFMVGWLCAAFLLGGAKLLASMMANDSGAASGNAHLAFIGGVMGGQLLTGLAGIPGGLAFFLKGRRKAMILIFLALLVTGIAIQAVAFVSFFR